MSYQLRDENVVWDAISPTNVVIADLENGRYTTLLGYGVEFFWNLLIEQQPISTILETLKEHFQQFDEKETLNVTSVVERLLLAEIITKAAPKPTKPVYAQPRFTNVFQMELTEYDDMELLLKLDPIDQLLED
jgi:hypothetical protein